MPGQARGYELRKLESYFIHQPGDTRPHLTALSMQLGVVDKTTCPSDLD